MLELHKMLWSAGVIRALEGPVSNEGWKKGDGGVDGAVERSVGRCWVAKKDYDVTCFHPPGPGPTAFIK